MKAKDVTLGIPNLSSANSAYQLLDALASRRPRPDPDGIEQADPLHDIESLPVHLNLTPSQVVECIVQEQIEKGA